MAATYTYPGVYVEEIPSGVRPISGVSTSNTAFIDFFDKGERNRAERIDSFGDFERKFGGLHPNSEASYGIQQYFINGGSTAFVVRVLHEADGETAAAATADLTAITVTARSEGTWGNRLAVGVIHHPTDDALFDLTVREYRGDRLAAVENFEGVTTAADAANNVATVVDEGSTLVTVDVTDDAARPPSAQVNADQAITDIEGQITAQEDAIDPLETAVTDADAAVVAAQDDLDGTDPADDAAVAAAEAVLAGAVQAAADAQGALAAAQAQLLALERDLRNATRAANIDELDDLGQSILEDLEDGSDGVEPGSEAWRTGASAAIIDGLAALDGIAPQVFNIMSIPAAAGLDAAGNAGVYAEAITFCEQRRAFLIADPPAELDTHTDVVAWADAPLSPNAAVFHPRLELGDALDANRPREFASSPTLAGIFARTDASRGVWKAPAGTSATLRGTRLRLTQLMTDKENGVLNTQGYNALRNFPIYNNISYGARTLVGSNAEGSEWKYIPVRRTALFIEGSLFQGLKWVVFEPNDEPLWAQIRLNVGAFMHNLYRKGAFQGCLLYTSPSPRDLSTSRMPSSA